MFQAFPIPQKLKYKWSQYDVSLKNIQVSSETVLKATLPAENFLQGK
jgi:hypothetical protein